MEKVSNYKIAKEVGKNIGKGIVKAINETSKFVYAFPSSSCGRAFHEDEENPTLMIFGAGIIGTIFSVGGATIPVGLILYKYCENYGNFGNEPYVYFEAAALAGVTLTTISTFYELYKHTKKQLQKKGLEKSVGELDVLRA